MKKILVSILVLIMLVPNVAFAYPEEVIPYTKKTSSITWVDGGFVEQLSNDLSENETTDVGKVLSIWSYMMKNTSYNYELRDAVIAGDAKVPATNIEKYLSGDGLGMCKDLTMAFAALLRAQSIPVKIIYGYIEGSKNYHAWNEVYLDNKWIAMDLTYDHYSIDADKIPEIFYEKSDERKFLNKMRDVQFTGKSKFANSNGEEPKYVEALHDTDYWVSGYHYIIFDVEYDKISVPTDSGLMWFNYETYPEYLKLIYK